MVKPCRQKSILELDGRKTSAVPMALMPPAPECSASCLPPQITMREGEVSILATQVVWMQKKIYLNKYNIPHGVLDITNQRVVYTRLSGDKVDFALEKSDIAAVIHREKIGVNIRAKNGTNYVINIMPPKHVEDALAQMGVPVER